MDRLTVYAWRTRSRNGPELVTTFSLFVRNEDRRIKSATWAMPAELAYCIFGKEVVDKIPLVPEQAEDAVPVSLSLVLGSAPVGEDSDSIENVTCPIHGARITEK